jgi:hypothetical protein
MAANREMVSKATLEAFEKSDAPVRNIVAVRMRRQKAVRVSKAVALVYCPTAPPGNSSSLNPA